jgi:periplasmic copper chaperone A
MSRFRGYLAGCVAACVVACSHPAPLTVSDAWIRSPAPGGQTAAGYFKLANQTAKPVVLTGAESDACASIEMHTTEHDGSTMRMVPLDRVEVPPGGTVTFEPGGRHLMLLHYNGVTAPTIDVTLRFEDGTILRVPFEVRSLSGSS